MWMSICTCRLLKINFVILKGTAFISSKSRFNLAVMIWLSYQDARCQKCRQTDRQTTFQLYIIITSVPALSCRCMHPLTYLDCYVSLVYRGVCLHCTGMLLGQVQVTAGLHGIQSTYLSDCEDSDYLLHKA